MQVALWQVSIQTFKVQLSKWSAASQPEERNLHLKGKSREVVDMVKRERTREREREKERRIQFRHSYNNLIDPTKKSRRHE